MLPSPVVHDSGKNPLGCDRSRDTPSTLALSPFIPQRRLRRLRAFSGSSEGPPAAASFTVRVSALGVLPLRVIRLFQVWLADEIPGRDCRVPGAQGTGR